MAKAIGGHIVGMSTALEAIAARQAGMEILGMSLITNLAAGIQKTPLSHQEVIEAGREAEPVISALLAADRGRTVSAQDDRRRRCSSGARLARPGPGPGDPRRAATRSIDRRRGRLGRRPSPTCTPASTTRLAFGTAGLRGEIAAGPNRMNRVLVAQAAAGLRRLPARARRRRRRPRVVIGYDGRKNSDVFARDTAELMAGAGVRAILLPRLLPTPVLAFAVRHLDVERRRDGHRQPQPAERQRLQGLPRRRRPRLADRLAGRRRDRRAHPARSRERQRRRPAALRRLRDRADESSSDAYIDATAAVASTDAARRRSRSSTRRCTASAGETAPRVLRARRASPQPTSSSPSRSSRTPRSRPSPSPTRRSRARWTSSFATAREAGADLVIANDPDADRLAVAIPDASSADGYRRLTGNEVGALLGWRAAELADADAPASAADRHARLLDRLVARPRGRRRARTASTSRTRSPASSGSPARPASSSATRRRSATW